MSLIGVKILYERIGTENRMRGEKEKSRKIGQETSNKRNKKVDTKSADAHFL